MQTVKVKSRLMMVWVITLVTSLAIAGCGTPFWLPPAHKIEVQQGNLVSEAQRETLQLGITREQVLSTLGQPVANNLFHADRWDYLYTKGPAGSAINARKLTVVFEDDRVVRIDDNYDEVSGEVPLLNPFWQRLAGEPALAKPYVAARRRRASIGSTSKGR